MSLASSFVYSANAGADDTLASDGEVAPDHHDVSNSKETFTYHSFEKSDGQATVAPTTRYVGHNERLANFQQSFTDGEKDSTSDTRVQLSGYSRQDGFDYQVWDVSGVTLINIWSFTDYGTGASSYFNGGVPYYQPELQDCRNDLERWLDGTSDVPPGSGGSEEPPVAPTSYPANPYSGNGLLGWFAGHAGDAGDQAIYVTGIVADIAAIPGTIILEPLDWAMTAKDIVLDPSNPLNYLGLIPGVPASAKKMFNTPGINTVIKQVDDVASAIHNKIPVEGPLYRGLAANEDTVKGLTARAPGIGNSVASHVAGKKQSQWISLTKDENIAAGKFGQHGYVKVDPSKIDPDSIVDISEGIPGMPGMLSNWAKKMREVLVKDHIPPGAIQ